MQPICGVIYHHAFELLLKSYFEKNYTSLQIKYKFGHKLKKLWNLFKKQFPNASLSKFDELIYDIDRWEGIRYMEFPERMWALAFTVDFNRHDKYKAKRNMSKLRKNGQELYSFMFDDADELFSMILSLIPVGPNYVKGVLIHKEAHEVYMRQNKFPYWKEG